MADPASPVNSHWLRRILIDLTIMTVIGVVLALIGPFGSFEAPLASRLIAWLGLAYVGYAIYSPLGLIVERLHRSLDLPRFGLWTAAAIVATVPMTAIVWSLNFVGQPVPWPPLETFLELYLYVLVIGGGITALFNVIGSNAERAPIEGKSAVGAYETPDPAADRATVRFFDRLPPELGSDLVALEMEDHYVRAHTALGSDLILLRMRDAVAELDGIEGLQVHRSWWVARGAVEDVIREGRNVRLVLANGIEAPVSRANVAMLRQAGWL